MIRALVFFAKLAVLVLIAIWLAGWPARVAIDLPAYELEPWLVRLVWPDFRLAWPGYRIDTTIGILVLGVVLVAERRMGKTSIIRKMKAEPQPDTLVLLSDVEGISEQSCQGFGVYRFLRGANREKQGVVCFGGPRTSPSQGCALQCYRTSDCTVDRSADH